ncbi:hypothetical protein CDAR_280461 [Caerostris darwini]|uniref:Uncharacterized protein n=1 Tax=Caerostris darwini TaxID=1538125 RepID=A0AAV4U4M1_9ARAC|nr:hypothetical protein CDAR_280461 [Caerostris darwini]
MTLAYLLLLLAAPTLLIAAANVQLLGRNHVDEVGECAGTCWCRRDSLTCQRPDTLDSIPLLASEGERFMITKMGYVKSHIFDILYGGEKAILPTRA